MAQAYTPNEHGDAHAKPHGPTVRGYVMIGLLLLAVTIVEIAASFMTQQFGLPHWIQIITLLVLATFKGAMVVSFFMHLRFDSRWFTFFFVCGIILATVAIVAMMTLFAYRAGYSG